MARWKESLKDRIDDLPDQLVPDEFLDHLRTSQRELLLALRSVMDFWVAGVQSQRRRAEPAAETPTSAATENPTPPRATTIRVEGQSEPPPEDAPPA